ncbi:MAG: universal stress protein [Pseudomonadota bacterium]
MKILASIDLSESSKIVVEQAKALAKACSAKIWLLHVAAPNPDFVGYEVDTKTMRDVVAERFHKEHQMLHRLGEEFRGEGLDCTALLVQGPTVETILSQAEKLSPDMIVLGSHGKGVIKQLLIGSTSEEVLHKSKIPVLVVPTRE